ncbi:small ribosomal subunit protein bS16m/bS16c-like [Rutidosis leptorrhynchoides]|uniref:small ribosomal subunit protein bS16m/bS16c-like n=1 Tax=Rutidosis leptorrhynchoides TaxID=125765 RepID=UPI003A9A00D7
MVVRLRLARLGCRNRPFYRVMAADSRSPRDVFVKMEVNGWGSILTKHYSSIHLGFHLTFLIGLYWLSVGAQPSDPVERLLFRAGVLPPPPMVAMGRKGGSRDTRPVDPLSGRVMIPDQPTKASLC